MLNQFKHIIKEDNENLSKGMRDFIDYQKNLKNSKKYKKLKFYNLIIFIISTLALISLFFVSVKNTKAESIVENLSISNNQITIPDDINSTNSLFCYSIAPNQTLTFNNNLISPFWQNNDNYIFKIDNVSLGASYDIEFSDSYSGGINNNCFIVDNISPNLISTSSNSTNAWVNPSVALANNVSQGDIILDFIFGDTYSQTSNDSSVVLSNSIYYYNIGWHPYLSANYKIAQSNNETLSFNMYNDGGGGSTHNIFVFSPLNFVHPTFDTSLETFDINYQVYNPDNSLNYDTSIDGLSDFTSFYFENINSTSQIVIEFEMPENYLDYENGIFNLVIFDKDNNFVSTESLSGVINSNNFPNRSFYYVISPPPNQIDNDNPDYYKIIVQYNYKVIKSFVIRNYYFSGDLPPELLYLGYDKFEKENENFKKTKNLWRKKIIFSTFMTIFDDIEALQAKTIFYTTEIDDTFSISIFNERFSFIAPLFEKYPNFLSDIYDISSYLFIGLFILYIIYRVRNSFGSQDT